MRIINCVLLVVCFVLVSCQDRDSHDKIVLCGEITDLSGKHLTDLKVEIENKTEITLRAESPVVYHLRACDQVD